MDFCVLLKFTFTCYLCVSFMLYSVHTYAHTHRYKVVFKPEKTEEKRGEDGTMEKIKQNQRLNC